ncbi:hypothetical protein V5799_005743 [Amblyomma americanum]|uniref:Glucose-methanol-choline oxidoreductase N-terminal domain-containing protein n=1 Tax=Amblyomma americanum TaxID=6943 RepID=A0AAQ4DYE4_AMBAM
MGASTCFLDPIRNLTNLHIWTRSTATQILFNDKEATGVKFIKEGKEYIAKFRHEVIVCAGAIGSPKLLMLSGIGRKEDLENRSIKVVADLPVGQGLQDHVVFLGLVITTKDDLIGLKKMVEMFALYKYNHTGLLSIPGGFEALLFTHSGVNKAFEDYPDVELELASVFPNKDIEHSPFVPPDVRGTGTFRMLNTQCEYECEWEIRILAQTFQKSCPICEENIAVITFLSAH